MLKFIIIFSLASLVNVMLNTAKTIIMYKNDKMSSALVNAVTYGFYTYIVVLMAGDMPLLLKMIITAVTNFVGVWLSMVILDKLRKDKLWKIEMTVPTEHAVTIDTILKEVPHSFIVISDKHTLFNFYCATQAESAKVKTIVDQYGARYFVSESKTL